MVIDDDDDDNNSSLITIVRFAKDHARYYTEALIGKRHRNSKIQHNFDSTYKLTNAVFMNVYRTAR